MYIALNLIESLDTYEDVNLITDQLNLVSYYYDTLSNLRETSPPKGAKQVLSKLKLMNSTKSNPITLLWAKGHTHCRGHNVADQIATLMSKAEIKEQMFVKIYKKEWYS